jgi:hypothetical protein
MMKKSVLIIIAVLFLNLSSKAQILINGGLEGVAGTDFPPNGWDVVPNTDPNCGVNTWAGATPDILTANGPSTSNGMYGNPYEGLSFVSGLYSGFPGDLYYNEGIKQTVSGFEINKGYRIGFWQTVIKQSPNYVDTTGSWGVYLDSNLIAVVPISHSLIAPGSLNHVWDYREVTFHATSNIHTIKFLPVDDDEDNDPFSIGDLGGSLRMGLDDIQLMHASGLGITEFTKENIRISPSPTKGEFAINVKNGISIRSVSITDYLGHLVDYQEFTSTNNGIIQMSMEGKPGIYFVVVTCEDGKEFFARIQKL